MNELRPYQIECIDIIQEHFKSNSSQLIQLPTGSGKTRIFLSYLKLHGGRSLIICPTIEIQQQVGRNACEILGVDNVFIKDRKNLPRQERCFVVVAASLTRERTKDILSKYLFDCIIIDEAHKAHCPTYTKFLKFYGKYHTNFKLLGMTATPERMDKKPLLEIFDKLTFNIDPITMINQGYLCDVVGSRIYTQHKLRSGELVKDFRNIDLKALNCKSRNDLIFKCFDEYCQHRKTLIFCLNVDHAIQISNYLESKNVKSAFIHGMMDKLKRQEILKKYKDGSIRVITNCQLLTEGFDEPSIEALIIARPTKSKSLYAQMVGRGMRNYPGKKNCYLYELTDNAHNICDFNVMGDKDPGFAFDYEKNTKLSSLKKLHDSVDLSEIKLQSSQINLFSKFSDHLDFEANEENMADLAQLGIKVPGKISFEEYKYLTWKHGLKEKYGFN